jgi:DNA-binding transcriptional LysR family regulator
MFTLDQLRAFVAVAEEMHFGRAAERLSMTQPPLSRQIQSLERNLSAQLFDRTRRTISLTAAGSAFLSEARRLLTLASAAAETARRTSLGLSGAVHIGFTSALGHVVLAGLLHEAAAKLPDVELILHEMVTADQLGALRDGTIDLGMIRPPVDDDELSFRALPPERLVVALPRAWQLVKAPPQHEDGLSILDISALNGCDFLMYSPDGARYFHELVAMIFKLHNVHPRFVQRVTQVHTMLSLVDAGLGAALVPESGRSWASANTRFAEVPQIASFPTESTLVWRRESTNPALGRTLELLRVFVQRPNLTSGSFRKGL